ncbi:hypothetical protein SEA_FROGHOPPER_78 [Mycobacterium phage Froghopper]|uniref:hypothetical protein n=1 Tax=Mycobacterium phage HanShotFirst TaxID=1429904 RepID=UPI0003C99B76|nr:hypothetical protein PBI_HANSHOTFIRST_89 [Mycobacterium phage HanShotFirst]AHB31866.1 hypothetical protein PBI_HANSHOTFIRST_89 [Mycobacterium phage HanShotFirst]AZF97264.1 hypothetical protein SEA_FROGHOPPER_78 [Mycobacterium phage Froghopper]
MMCDCYRMTNTTASEIRIGDTIRTGSPINPIDITVTRIDSAGLGFIRFNGQVDHRADATVLITR